MEDDLRRREGNDLDNALRGGLALRRNELFIGPRLDGVFEHDEAPENVLNNLEEVPHLVPGPVVAGVGIEGEDVAPNAPLLQLEQEDLQALRNVLGVPVQDHVINAQLVWQSLQSLKAKLPKTGPYRILQLQADYARILKRTARVMTIPTREIFEATPHHYSLIVSKLCFRRSWKRRPNAQLNTANVWTSFASI